MSIIKTTQRQVTSLLIIISTSFFSFSQEPSDKIWVTFESAEDIPQLTEDELHSSNTEIQTLIEEFSITQVEQAVPSSQKESLLNVYEVSCMCDADELSKAIRTRSTSLSNPEPAPVYELLNTPDDYTANYQVDYALDLIQAEGAWQYSTGDEFTVIGISDANYYTAHEDLEGKIEYLNPQNTSTNYYHGTAVAITAAGHTNNEVGKSSIGYNCKLHLTESGYNQLIVMSQIGIRVINVSWASGCTANSYIQQIIDEIYENGSILVAAAGNGSTCGGAANAVFPAACDHVISVTSIGENDQHEKIAGDPTSTHQHHSTVDICAPGYNVALSLAPGYYGFGSGSSFAAPLVSGTIGLMLSLKPCLTFEEVEEILRLSSDDISALNPNYLGQLGMGRLNAAKALELTTMNQCDGLITNPVLTVDTLTGVITINGTSSPNTNTNSFPDLDEQNAAKYPSAENLSAGIEQEQAVEIRLYPNPTNDVATIECNAMEVMEIQVIDALGKVVEQRLLQSGKKQIQLAFEQSGIYFIKLSKDSEQVWFGKLVRL